MSFNLPARVKHTSTTTGSGTLTLIDPASNMQAFSAFAGAGPTKVMYAIAGASYWELGIGTYTGGGTKTLTRDTILASSSGGSAVSLPVATHDVFAWWPGGFPSAVISGTATLGLADLFQSLIYTGSAGTLNLPAVANVPAGILLPFINAGSGDWTHDANGSETINGATTNVIKPGQGGWLFYQGPTSGQWREIISVGANPAALDVAQTFTQAQIILAAALNLLTVTSTDATSSGGPNFDLFRDSASPAASDVLGDLIFSGRSSTGVKRTYAEILAFMDDAANTSEDARLFLRTIVAGTLASRLLIGNGVYTPSATGGDPGADKINAKGYQIDGVAIPISKSYVSSDQTQAAGGAVGPLAHGLGAEPLFVELYLVCQTAELGYAIGDVVAMRGNLGTGANQSYAVFVDATNITIRIGSTGLGLLNKSTGVGTAITDARWKIRVKAGA